MKIVIQDVTTKQYFCGGEWVLNSADAADFKTAAEAITLGFQLGLENFEVVHVFDVAEQNFSTGVLNFSKRPTSHTPPHK